MLKCISIGILSILMFNTSPVSASPPRVLKCKILGPCDLVEPGEACIAIGIRPLDLNFDFSRGTVRSKPWKAGARRGKLGDVQELELGEHLIRVSWSRSEHQDAIFSSDWTRLAFNVGGYGSFACTPVA